MYGQDQAGRRPDSDAGFRPNSSSNSGADAETRMLEKYDDAKFQDPDIGNAYADALRGPNARALSVGELQWVGTAYGTLISAVDVVIINGPGNNGDARIAFDIGGNPAITEGNNIYIKQKYYSVDFADQNQSTYSENIDTLIHECTHVFQYRTIGFFAFYTRYIAELIAFGGANECYRYDKRKLHFRYESLEGQAAMVGHYAQYLAGGTPSNADTMKNIETRLKSSGIFMM
jgi:hypothetical protein